MNEFPGKRNVIPLISALLILLAPVPGLAQSGKDEFGFAQSLMDERDYFRAITEYKRILFYSPADELSGVCMYRIALAYLKSSHFSISLSYLDRLNKMGDAAGDMILKSGLLYGINFYFLNEYDIARGYFDKSASADSSGIPQLFLGLLSAEKGLWKEASQAFQDAAGKAGSTENSQAATSLARDILKGETLDSRDPFLAGFFSALLPGSGQAYTGHWFDALNAFSMVGIFGFATYMAYSYESQQNNGLYVYTAIGGVITGIFYVANIAGAARTADFYTARQKQDFMDGIRNRVFDFVK
jgi:tetratricopeptide (TPR) repeat protein